jgi:hypothetical protein
MLIATVAAVTFGINCAEAANVSVNINGYIPAPPGVYVQMDAGRPYYVEHAQRVYMEKEKPGKHHKYKKEKKHHEDNGNKYGHEKHESHDNHEGHSNHQGHGH